MTNECTYVCFYFRVTHIPHSLSVYEYIVWLADILYPPHIASLGLLQSDDTPMTLPDQLRSQPPKRCKHIILCDDVILLQKQIGFFKDTDCFS